MIVNLACGIVCSSKPSRERVASLSQRLKRCDANLDNVSGILQSNSKLWPPRRLGQMHLRNQAPARLGLLHHILEANADAAAFRILVLADVDSGLVGEGEAGEKFLLDVPRVEVGLFVLWRKRVSLCERGGSTERGRAHHLQADACDVQADVSIKASHEFERRDEP